MSIAGSPAAAARESPGIAVRSHIQRSRESLRAAFDEGKNLAAWLLIAAVVRQFLGIYVVAPRGKGSSQRVYSEYVSQISEGPAGLTATQAISQMLISASSGKLLDCLSSFAQRQKAARIFTNIEDTYVLREGAANTDDPLSQIIRSKSPWTPESELQRRCFANAETGVHWDDLANLLFLQYLRIRNIFYRHLTVRPGTPGLQWFGRHYGRLQSLSPSFSPKARFTHAAEISGISQGLKSLELRSTTPRTKTATLKYISELFSAIREYQSQGNPINTSSQRAISTRQSLDVFPRLYHTVATEKHGLLEAGLVVHIARDRGGGSKQGRPEPMGTSDNGNPSSSFNRSTTTDTGTRYFAFFHKTLQMIQSLSYVLRRYPLSVQIVRGFDVCSDESGVPIWVCVPLVKELEVASASARRFLKRACKMSVPKCGKSIHAGEDFVHLQSGLRRVDEAIEWLRLDEGDRIGHGLAVGYSTCAWAEAIGCVTMPKGHRLWDLVWEYSLFANGLVNSDGNMLGRLELEIRDISYEVFGDKPPTPQELVRLRDDLGDSQLFEWSLPRPLFSLQEARARLKHRYLTDGEIYAREMQPVHIDVSQSGIGLAKIQEYLLKKIARRGITIEVNPTSNLLVGGFGDLKSHPLWRLKPPGAKGGLRVPICIGSDDPVLLSSSLCDEYQRIADAMHRAGVIEEDIIQWIECARETGLNRRFTLPEIVGNRVDEIVNHNG